MKKTTKRILAFLAAAAMALSLTACTGGDADVTDSGDVADGKLFAEGTEISAVIASHASWPYNENWVMWDYITEATGATLNIKAIPSVDLGTKIPLMMANSAELPDIMHTWAKNQVDPYAPSGAFMSISDNLDNMPNLKAFLDSQDELTKEEMINKHTSGDGKVYSAPSWGTQRVSNIRTWLYRKDVFEKHGLELPKTYDELYAVAKKLKELYPDSYPICFRSGHEKLLYFNTAWQPYMEYLQYYDFTDSTWKFGAQQPIMKDVVEFWRKLHTEGLVPPDYINIESKAWEELMSTDRGFITFDYIVRIDHFNNAVRGENPEYTLAQMAPPVPNVESGRSTIAKTNLDLGGWTICNTGDKTGIANAFKYIDWMYTPEAIELLSWGKEGETYNLTADGKKEFILEPGEQVNTKYGIASYGMYQIIEEEAYENTYSQENIDACIQAADYMEDRANPKMWLALSEEEEDRAAAIQDDLESYCLEELSKFLLNQNSMSEWDNFQKGLIDMNVEELLEIYTAAYKRVVGE